MLGEPEDGEHHALYAAGVGCYFVEAVDDGDVVAGAVDDEVAGHGHAVGVAEFVEEAFARVFVDVEVLNGTCYGFAEEVGVDDEVGDVDGVA